MLKRTMATGLLLALLASGPTFADSVIYTKQTVVSNDLLPLEEQSLTLWTDVPLLAPSTAVSLYYDDGSLRYWPGDTYNPIYRIRNIWPLLVIMNHRWYQPQPWHEYNHYGPRRYEPYRPMPHPVMHPRWDAPRYRPAPSPAPYPTVVYRSGPYHSYPVITNARPSRPYHNGWNRPAPPRRTPNVSWNRPAPPRRTPNVSSNRPAQVSQNRPQNQPAPPQQHRK